MKSGDSSTYGMTSILVNYQERIDRQNSRIMTDKNKYEVNTDLREFETAQR